MKLTLPKPAPLPSSPLPANRRRSFPVHQNSAYLSISVAALMLSPMPACPANTIQCYEAPGTLNYLCIDAAAVRANGELRMSPIYSGGPRGITKAPYFIVTHCARGISTLQDKNGSNFGGGYNSQTPAIQSLSTWLCAVPSPKQDKSIRQF